MKNLMVLIDYDNVDQALRRTGVINMAKTLIGQLPVALLVAYETISVRLYGGWRANNTTTIAAQKIVPEIQRDSPTIIKAGDNKAKRFVVEMAYGPIGSNSIIEEMLVRGRSLRSFRAKANLACANTESSCGFSMLATMNHLTPCSRQGCENKLVDIFERDEQKMVDTLIVADIAHLVFVQKNDDIVVVSSDVDMWPGVLLAARSGCTVHHIHPKRSWRTQRYLPNTLGNVEARYYKQASL